MQAPELLARERVVRAAVTALPTLPSTSPHLMVRTFVVPLAIRELAAGLLGTIEVAPPPPAPHVHSPHCFHARTSFSSSLPQPPLPSEAASAALPPAGPTDGSVAPPPADASAGLPTGTATSKAKAKAALPLPSAMETLPIEGPVPDSGVYAVNYPNGDRYEGAWCVLRGDGAGRGGVQERTKFVGRGRY